MYIVSDLKKATDFYQNTLGLKLTSKGESWAEFDSGTVAIILGTWGNDPHTTGKNGNGVALAVDDVQKTLDELKAKGVKVNGDSWDTPVCIGASFQDPDGNTIYLHKRKDGTVG